MTDEPFDAFLTKSLAPGTREPDRHFVKQVQMIVKLDQRLRAQRRAALRRLGLQSLAIGSVAASLVWLVQSPDISAAIGESPELALGGLLAAFGLLLALIGSGEAQRASA
jgi:hypothetical protein